MPENTNTQVPPVPETPVAAGPSAAELQAQLDEMKKQSEGRLRDLQNERAKRQELEAKLAPSPASSAPNVPDVTQDELGKVLTPYIAPALEKAKKAEAFMNQYTIDKAMDFLKEKTGKSREAIEADVDFQQKLLATANKWGFGGDIYQKTVRAYEAMQLEDMKAKEVERARVANANASNGLPSGTPPPAAPGKKSFSGSEFNDMPLHEYEKYMSEGTFHQDEQGNIVYTRNK